MSSLFWKYFRNTLRWPLIWKEGPISAVVKGAAGVLDGARDDIAWLRSQFLPGRCDVDHLGRFAVAQGLSRLPSESDDAWHRRIVQAWFYWRAGGTKDGMQRLLEEFFEGAEIDEAAGGWAEFGVEVGLASAAHTSLLLSLINDVKPARSKLTSLRLSSTVGGDALGAGLVVRPASVSVGRATRLLAGSASMGAGAVVVARANGPVRSIRIAGVSAPAGLGCTVRPGSVARAGAERNYELTGAAGCGAAVTARMSTHIGGS